MIQGVLWVRGVWVCELAENVGFGSGFSVFRVGSACQRVRFTGFCLPVWCRRVFGRVEADGGCRQLRVQSRWWLGRCSVSATGAVVGCCFVGGAVVAAFTVIVLAVAVIVLVVTVAVIVLVVASVVVGVAGGVFGQQVFLGEAEVGGDGDGERRDQVRSQPTRSTRMRCEPAAGACNRKHVLYLVASAVRVVVGGRAVRYLLKRV